MDAVPVALFLKKLNKTTSLHLCVRIFPFISLLSRGPEHFSFVRIFTLISVSSMMAKLKKHKHGSLSSTSEGLLFRNGS